MTIDAPDTTPSIPDTSPTPTPEPAPAKKSPVAGNIVFVVSSLVSTIACCLCAVAGAAVSPSAFTALQQYQATRLAAPVDVLDGSDIASYATATAQADIFSNLDVSLRRSDTFDTASSFWVSGSYEDDYSQTDYEIENGKYIWDMKAHQGVVIRGQYPTAFLGDFYVTVEVEMHSEADGAQYGIVFRDNREDYYVFLITDNLEFSVLMFKDGFWQMMVGPVATSNLLTDNVNRLTVVGQGSHFDFYINNEHIADMDDESLTVGQVGLATGLQEDGDTGTFEFDNFELWMLYPQREIEIPKLAPTRTPSP